MIRTETLNWMICDYCGLEDGPFTLKEIRDNYPTLTGFQFIPGRPSPEYTLHFCSYDCRERFQNVTTGLRKLLRNEKGKKVDREGCTCGSPYNWHFPDCAVATEEEKKGI